MIRARCYPYRFRNHSTLACGGCIMMMSVTCTRLRTCNIQQRTLSTADCVQTCVRFSSQRRGGRRSQRCAQRYDADDDEYHCNLSALCEWRARALQPACRAVDMRQRLRQNGRPTAGGSVNISNAVVRLQHSWNVCPGIRWIGFSGTDNPNVSADIASERLLILRRGWDIIRTFNQSQT